MIATEYGQRVTGTYIEPAPAPAEPTSKYAALSPREIDEKLAELYWEHAQAEQRTASALESLRHMLGQRTTGRRADRVSRADTLAAAEARRDEYNIMYGRTFGEMVDKYAALVRVAESIETEADEYNDEYDRRGGWSRFFTVQQHNGHVHSSMHCQTCNRNGQPTSFGWNPKLSGKSEAEAVAELGPSLCTVCFPSAPVEWTVGKPAPVHCAGSGKAPEGKGRQTYGASRYGRCGTCGDFIRMTQYGVLIKHKPSTTK